MATTINSGKSKNSVAGKEDKPTIEGSKKLRLITIGSFTTIFMMCTFLILFFFKTYKYSKQPPRYMSYEGEAEKNIAADTIEYSIYFEKIGNSQAELIKEINNEKPIVLKFFEDAGLSKEEISVYDYIHEDYSRSSDEIKYRMGYCVSIISNKLQIVLNLRNNLSELYQKGVNIKKQRFVAKNSKLPEIKQNLAIEATENAVKNARDLAANIGIKSREILNIQEPYYEVNSSMPIGIDGNTLRFSSGFGENSIDEYSNSQALAQKVKAKVKIQLRIK